MFSKEFIQRLKDLYVRSSLVDQEYLIYDVPRIYSSHWDVESADEFQNFLTSFQDLAVDIENAGVDAQASQADYLLDAYKHGDFE